MSNAVRVRREPVILPTYEPAEADKNPMFLEKRVYQGSSGRVYPLPFIDRIAETPTDRSWDAIYLDNGFIEVMLLPEIGGRIHAIRDLTNGFDCIYRQHVIKPALVGLAGPWVSGGVEFNWPQHHRPSTFMPTEVSIEYGKDGSITVWMSEHEPMNRMKGMHGICLHPDRKVVEIKVRLYNRTPYTQTFLWWTNIGVRVHEGYKSFFPPDATTIADHAKRAVSSYPLCEGRYYGVDYGARDRSGVPQGERPSHFLPANSGGSGPDYRPNDLSWYANIPVPTSYMCVSTDHDFFGGYDFFNKAGLIHVADHHISPGKKQWTWGNHEFGYAWDRNLTDSDGPYIELMAGVYTDNQPDFSFLNPGETRAFSQFLYPFKQIGPAKFANVDAAIAADSSSIGICVTRPIEARVVARTSESFEHEWKVSLSPDRPFIQAVEGVIEITLLELDRVVGEFSCESHHESALNTTLQPATEPPLPGEVESADELFLIGQHLEQYRHATRSPVDYWQEALRRDSGDVRCNNALGLWRLKRGEFDSASEHFETAIRRATSRNPNPSDGEPFYNFGIALRFLGRYTEAIDAFAKAAWNSAWQGPAWHALGELACIQQNWTQALEYLERSIRKDQDNLRARCLRVIVLRKLGRTASAADILQLDPLDPWARLLDGISVKLNNNTCLDIVIDLMRAGLTEEAMQLLGNADHTSTDGDAPMVAYYQAFLSSSTSADPYARAAIVSPDYCFPARLEDIAILKAAPPTDGRAPYYLGNLMYDRRRYAEAIDLWESAVRIEPTNAIAHRNLGIAAFNVLHDPTKARAEYDAAIGYAPEDARLLYERDQLWRRLGVAPYQRLAELDQILDLVAKRDDLTIEYCALLLATGNPEKAEDTLRSRKFQPWEGGEGMALGVYSRTHLELGRRSLKEGEADRAKLHFTQIVFPPQNLGEARHLLANASDAWLALGDACSALGEPEEARRWWTQAAEFKGDFQEMAVQPFSEFTCFQAEALRRLGRNESAESLLRDLKTYAQALENAPVKVDYFATSLPSMLLFDDDLQARQTNAALYLQAQVAAGLGDIELSQHLINQVLEADPNHPAANDFKRSQT